MFPLCIGSQFKGKLKKISLPSIVSSEKMMVEVGHATLSGDLTTEFPGENLNVSL